MRKIANKKTKHEHSSISIAESRGRYRTPVGEGVFTCCKLGHKLPTPNGVIDIPCDKVKVATVLETMYDNKVHQCGGFMR